MAKTPRTWTGARSPSGLKRVRQGERRHAILGPRRSAARTLVKTAVEVANSKAEGADPATALAAAMSALDRAAKAGAIHPNAAARRKSRLALKVNAALGGAHVQLAAHETKQISKAAAAKAAKARIAAAKADKAKGAQTAAGKARVALSKTTRTAEPSTGTATEPATPKATKGTAKTASKGTTKASAKGTAKTAAKSARTTSAAGRTAKAKADAAETAKPAASRRTKKAE